MNSQIMCKIKILSEKIENHPFGRANPGTASGGSWESPGPRGTPVGCQEGGRLLLVTERCLHFSNTTQTFERELSQSSSLGARGPGGATKPVRGALSRHKRCVDPQSQKTLPRASKTLRELRLQRHTPTQPRTTVTRTHTHTQLSPQVKAR